MQPADRASGTFDFALDAAREGDRRAMKFILDARGDNADHALMPLRVIEAQGVAAGVGGLLKCCERGFLHLSLDASALAVQGVQLLRDGLRARGVVGNQAFNAERHIGQSSGGVQAWAYGEAEIVRAGARRITRGHTQQRGNARLRLARAYAIQAVMHEDAIVFVEPHHVGDGTQRHQIKQVRQIR